MTKVTTLQSLIVGTTEAKKGNPIELVKLISKNGEFIEANFEPSDYDNIVLIARGYSCRSQYDIIAAWDNNVNADDKGVFLGHWNDGFVEQ